MPPVQLDSPGALREYVGREIGASDWMRLEQERIDRFADVTEDRQWIHVDRERAERESPFHATIAHGFLTLSLMSHLSKQAFKIRSGIRLGLNYGLNRVRFPWPVRAGSMIRARVGLVSLKDIEGGLEATLLVTVETEGGTKPCCVAEWVVRYYLE
jgi:acyl dehydratase